MSVADKMLKEIVTLAKKVARQEHETGGLWDKNQQLEDERDNLAAEVEALKTQLENAQRELSEQSMVANVETQQDAAAWQQQLDAARAEIETLRGAMAADDKRLRDAEERIWPLRTLGRGAPDAMAAEILHLRGAMAADDKRLRDAEERIWPGVTWGCDAPDKMADEIETLRQQLAEQQAETVDVRRQRNNETDRLNATNAVSVQQRDEIAYLRARLHEERSVSAGLRQQLDAANAAQALWQADSNLLERFAATVRSRFNPGWTEDDLPEILSAVSAVFEALAELDAGTEPAPVAEPAPCPECERLRAELETANEHRTDLVLFVDKVRKSFRVWGGDQSFFDSVSHALDELDANSSATLTSSPTPVAEPLDAEGGQ